MTEDELKKMAEETYIEYKDSGHVPIEIADYPYLSEDEYEMYANSLEISIEEYKKYLTYLLEYYSQ